MNKARVVRPPAPGFRREHGVGRVCVPKIRRRGAGSWQVDARGRRLSLAALVVLIALAAGFAVLPTQALAAPEVVYRVNAGGPTLSATPAWSADTEAVPSSFVNASATGNTTFFTNNPIDVSHPSIPAGTPAALFQTERWDDVRAPRWSGTSR